MIKPVKISDKNALVAELADFIAKNDFNMTKLGEEVGIAGGSLSGYIRGDSLPTSANYAILKAYMDRPEAERYQAYLDYVRKSTPANLEKRVAALEDVTQKLWQALKLLENPLFTMPNSSPTAPVNEDKAA